MLNIKQVKGFIQKTWYEKLIHRNIRSPLHGIYNIIRWSLILFKDKDYSSEYILIILKQKLINQREYIVSKDRHMDVDDIGKQITRCVEIIDDLLIEYTAHYYQDVVDLIYQPYFVSKDVVIDGKTYYELETKFKVSLTEDEEKLFPIITRYALLKGGKEHKELINELFDILRDNLFDWWD